ncbi:hypothetical protein HMI54_003971 [Coelomomyces lativittatus]|nr:hypothetical protein HMI54_003971 [Coelomomyces lativittatus]
MTSSNSPTSPTTLPSTPTIPIAQGNHPQLSPDPLTHLTSTPNAPTTPQSKQPNVPPMLLVNDPMVKSAIDHLLNSIQPKNLPASPSSNVHHHFVYSILPNILVTGDSSSIREGMSWFLSHGLKQSEKTLSALLQLILAQAMALSPPTSSIHPAQAKKQARALLFGLYLIHDILHQAKKKPIPELLEGLTKVNDLHTLVAQARCHPEMNKVKLEKLLGLWREHQYFSETFLDTLGHPTIASLPPPPHLPDPSTLPPEVLDMIQHMLCTGGKPPSGFPLPLPPLPNTSSLPFSLPHPPPPPPPSLPVPHSIQNLPTSTSTLLPPSTLPHSLPHLPSPMSLLPPPPPPPPPSSSSSSQLPAHLNFPHPSNHPPSFLPPPSSMHVTKGPPLMFPHTPLPTPPSMTLTPSVFNLRAKAPHLPAGCLVNFLSTPDKLNWVSYQPIPAFELERHSALRGHMLPPRVKEEALLAFANSEEEANEMGWREGFLDTWKKQRQGNHAHPHSHSHPHPHPHLHEGGGSSMMQT